MYHVSCGGGENGRTKIACEQDPNAIFGVTAADAKNRERKKISTFLTTKPTIHHTPDTILPLESASSAYLLVV